MARRSFRSRDQHQQFWRRRSSRARFALQGQREPRDQLLEYLRGKELLLVLDNFEQLLTSEYNENEGSADCCRVSVRAAGLTLLVTSRERLALQGEWLFDLSGLSYPAGELANGAENYSAVRLSCQRAGQVRRQFVLRGRRGARGGADLPAGRGTAAGDRAGGCGAAHALLYSDRRRDRGATCWRWRSELRAVPERHRSIWATFEHSWRLLSEKSGRSCQAVGVSRRVRGDAAAEVAQASPQSWRRSWINRCCAGMAWSATTARAGAAVCRREVGAGTGDVGHARRRHAEYLSRAG